MSTSNSPSPYRSFGNRIINPSNSSSPSKGTSNYSSYEYVNRFKIDKLAETLLDVLLSKMPYDPYVCLAMACRKQNEKHKAAMQVGASVEAQHFKYQSPNSYSSVPLPWATSSNDTTPEYYESTTRGLVFNFKSKDYIQRNRVACIFDEWYIAIVTQKPTTPALYSFNYFLQRSVMRDVLRQQNNEALDEDGDRERRQLMSSASYTMHISGSSVESTVYSDEESDDDGDMDANKTEGNAAGPSESNTRHGSLFSIYTEDEDGVTHNKKKEEEGKDREVEEKKEGEVEEKKEGEIKEEKKDREIKEEKREGEIEEKKEGEVKEENKDGEIK